MQAIEILHDLARANAGLFTTQTACAAGISSQRLTDYVRRGVIARVARGVYAVGARAADVPDPHRITRAWRVVLSYQSAAAWWGIELSRAVGRLHVTAPRSRGRWRDAVAGVRLHRANLADSDIVTCRGVRVTSPLRTCLDVARRASLEEAVAIVDGFLRKGLVRLDDFDRAARAVSGPGRARVQLVAELVDPRSGSVLESLTRVLLWRHGLLPEETQYPFKHPRTGWVGYLDFAWPRRRAALEADGYEYHADREVFQKDRRRWSALNRADWRSGVVTWFDVTLDPMYVVELVRDLLSPEVAA